MGAQFNAAPNELQLDKSAAHTVLPHHRLQNSTIMNAAPSTSTTSGNGSNIKDEENVLVPASLLDPFTFDVQLLVDQGRVKADALDQLRLYVANHSPLSVLNEQQLALFLMSCQNDLERTYHTIWAYFRTKSSAPNLHSARHALDPMVQQANNIIELAMLHDDRQPTGGPCILLGRLIDANYRNYILENTIKTFLMALEVSLFRKVPPTGLVVVFDMQNVSLMHLTRLRINVIRDLLQFVEEALPVQLKCIHVLNNSYVIQKLFAFVKPLMKPQLIELMSFHSSNYSLTHTYDACLIPVEYGGTAPPIIQLVQQTTQLLHQYSVKFKTGEQQVLQYQQWAASTEMEHKQ